MRDFLDQTRIETWQLYNPLLLLHNDISDMKIGIEKLRNREKVTARIDLEVVEKSKRCF